MLLPSKYEKINKNLLVLGAEVLKRLKKKSYTIEDLYQILKGDQSINLEQYYNCITFLWLADLLTLNDQNLSVLIKK